MAAGLDRCVVRPDEAALSRMVAHQRRRRRGESVLQPSPARLRTDTRGECGRCQKGWTRYGLLGARRRPAVEWLCTKRQRIDTKHRPGQAGRDSAKRRCYSCGLFGPRFAGQLGRFSGSRLRDWTRLQRSVKRCGHCGITAQQVTPPQFNLGPSLAFASQAKTVGVDHNGVVRAIDGDLPPEFSIQDRSHVTRTPNCAHCASIVRVPRSRLSSIAAGPPTLKRHPLV